MVANDDSPCTLDVLLDRVNSCFLDFRYTECTFVFFVLGKLASFMNKDVNETKLIHLMSVWASELCFFHDHRLYS